MDDGSDFRIDFNVFDAELLKLREKLKKLNLKKMQCDLADAMIALQITVMKR